MLPLVVYFGFEKEREKENKKRITISVLPQILGEINLRSVGHQWRAHAADRMLPLNRGVDLSKLNRGQLGMEMYAVYELFSIN